MGGQTFSPTLLQWMLACIPIACVLVLMVFFRWGATKAGPVGWLAAITIGGLVFKGGPLLLAYSQLEALLMALYVLYIIWTALALFRVVEAAGAIQAVGQGIVHLTTNRLLQLLTLSWVFSAFLQGVAGFGVPVAVVAPLLVGLGFSPMVAVAATAIGHSWAVTFGDIAASFNALIASTGLSGLELAPWSSAFLGLACLGCGLAVGHLHGGWPAMRQSLPIVLLVGGFMALTQYVLARNGLWNLAGFAAGMAGLAGVALITRLPRYRGSTSQSQTSLSGGRAAGRMSIGLALLPYVLLSTFVTAAELWRPLHQALNNVHISLPFPEVSTGLGWSTPARLGREISLFGHSGALLVYTAVITYGVFRATGYLQRGDLRSIVSHTVRSATPASVGILSLVGMAMIMDRCGMTHILALGLSSTMGRVLPLASPFVGMLGSFMTGSNTNSNMLFGPLQKSSAELVGLSVAIVLGAQTSGGALGSMIAPAKLIVGCATGGLEGHEGKVLRRTLPYALIITAAIGLLAWLVSAQW